MRFMGEYWCRDMRVLWSVKRNKNDSFFQVNSRNVSFYGNEAREMEKYVQILLMGLVLMAIAEA